MRKSMLITSIIVILISSLIINASAEEVASLSTNDLFIKYPYYLNNAETNAITQRATDTYHDVMSDYDENDEFISAIKSGVSSSVETVIRDIGSWLGLMDSYYETCMDSATIELMQTLYADENLIAGMDVVKKSSEILEDVRNVSEITAVKSCEIAAALENLSESDVLAMTEELVENSGDILDSVEDAVNMAKYIYTACIITDVQLEMIDVLMERVDKNGELYEGLSRLRHKMSYNIVEYTGLTFIKNRGLEHIADTVTKLGLNSFGISTGPFLIGQIIAKTAVWVMFDIIYPHPGADEVISNMIHSMYVMELETSLMNQRLAFYEPFYVSDIDDYETVFNVYLAAIKTTLESTKALTKNETAKQSLEVAKKELEEALTNYEAYINKCKNAVLSTAAEERIMRAADQTMIISGNAIIGENGDFRNYSSIPLTSDSSTYWGLSISGTLIVNDAATIPVLSLNGTLDVNADITVDGGFNNAGTLKMVNDDDYVLVKGNYIQRGTSDYITAGTLEIKGNITESQQYKPTGTHKTVLSGDSEQHVNMPSGNVIKGFNILELRNTSEDGIVFDNVVHVRKEISHNGGKITNGKNVKLYGEATIREPILNMDITVFHWTDNSEVEFNGVLYCEGRNYFNHRHKVNKIDFIYSSELHVYKELYIETDLYITGKVELNHCSLIVDGNFKNSGTLKMANDDDYVLVKGSYTQSGTSDYITAGTLEIKGDMINCCGYRASGTHRTILSGNSSQKIDLRNGNEQGKFNILEVRNTAEEGVEFVEQTYVYGELSSSDKTKIIKGKNLYISQNALIKNLWNGDLSAYGWTNNEKCIVNGDLEIVQHSSLTQINADVFVKGKVTIQTSTSIQIGASKLEVGEDFVIYGGFGINDDAGYVLVNGDYYENKTGNVPEVIAGTLEIKGDMINCCGYRASGTHRTILSGNSGQKIDLRNGNEQGKFNILEVRNTAEEGVTFEDGVNVLSDILQPIGTKVSGNTYIKLQNKPAFIDYGELNTAINRFNGNAENVIPTWLDYERYCKFALDGDKAFILNESITNTSFDCDLYFSNDYNKSSAVVIVAFYDGDNRFVQMASKPVDVKAGKIDVSIDFESKPYSKYKIMVWESLDNLKPLMVVK